MKRTTAMTAILAAAAIGVAGSAGAQQAQGAELSESDVREFFETAQTNIAEAVEQGNLRKIVEWTQDYMSDGATVTMTDEIYSGDERKRFTTTSLDKEDLVRWGRVAVGAMGDMYGQKLQDYELSVDVTDVRMIGPNAASVTAEISETASLSLPGDIGTGDGGQQGQQTGQMTQLEVQSDATCNYVIHQEEGVDHLMIGMTTCQGRTRL